MAGVVRMTAKERNNRVLRSAVYGLEHFPQERVDEQYVEDDWNLTCLLVRHKVPLYLLSSAQLWKQAYLKAAETDWALQTHVRYWEVLHGLFPNEDEGEFFQSERQAHEQMRREHLAQMDKALAVTGKPKLEPTTEIEPALLPSIVKGKVEAATTMPLQETEPVERQVEAQGLPVQELNYYEILGIGHEASQEEIQETYSRVMARYRPSVYTAPDADERRKIITQAYETLSDPEKRKTYDAQLGETGA
jgi:hypothetical protein